MTIIAAIHDPKEKVTYIGSDTLITSGSHRLGSAGFKFVVHDGWAIGISGRLRTQNLVEVSAARILGDISGPMDFCNRIRSLLDEDGYGKADDDGGSRGYSQFCILASASGVWYVGPDFSYISIPGGVLCANGSGEDYALGAAHLGCAIGLAPREVLRRAIEAAISYETNCGGDILIEELR